MSARGVVQRGLRTPTGPFFARCFIGIILGLVAEFAFMGPSTRSDVVFRCTLDGSQADRWLEVPALMFDRTAYPDPELLTACQSASKFGSDSLLMQFVGCVALRFRENQRHAAGTPPLQSGAAWVCCRKCVLRR